MPVAVWPIILFSCILHIANCTKNATDGTITIPASPHRRQLYIITGIANSAIIEYVISCMRTFPVPFIWCIYMAPIILQKVKKATAADTYIDVSTLSPNHNLKMNGDIIVSSIRIGKVINPIFSSLVAQCFIQVKSLRV